MGFLPQRRLRFLALATLFTIIFTYTFYHSPVTWHTPIASPVSVPPALKPVQPPSKESSIIFDTVPGKPDVSVIPEGLPSDRHPTKKPDTLNLPLPLQPDVATTTPNAQKCIKYEVLQRQRQKPWSEGRHQFPYSRPDPECRTFNLRAMENLIEKMKAWIKDPDLFRLFENSYPNTLDTMIKWRGYAKVKDEATGNETITDEELTYVITGDVSKLLGLLSCLSYLLLILLVVLSISCYFPNLLQL